MSDRYGTVRAVWDPVRLIRPPRTTVCPLEALTTVWARMRLIRGERMIVPLVATEMGIPSASGPTSDWLASISMTTRPSGLILGVTPRIKPVSWYWTLLVCPYWVSETPRMEGTSWPTWM